MMRVCVDTCVDMCVDTDKHLNVGCLSQSESQLEVNNKYISKLTNRFLYSVNTHIAKRNKENNDT